MNRIPQPFTLPRAESFPAVRVRTYSPIPISEALISELFPKFKPQPGAEYREIYHAKQWTDLVELIDGRLFHRAARKAYRGA